MWTRLRDVLQPMNLAAYVAWLAIGGEVWTRPASSTGLVDGPWLYPLVLLLHVGFLALFVARQLLGRQAWHAAATVFAQLAVALAMAALARYGSTPVLLIIALAQLTQFLSPWRLGAMFVLVNLAMYAIYRGLWNSSTPLMGTLIYASFQLFAIMTAWYAFTAGRSRDALAVVNAELLATRSLLEQGVRDSERLRLSRELHDIAGHGLTALKLNLRALQRQPALANDAQLALCARLADDLLGDIRGLVQQMRLHDGVALGELIARLAAPFPRPRLHLEMDDRLRVPTLEQAEAVMRTVQEALTNAARHGGADNLWLSVRHAGTALQLEFRDDGRAPAGELCFGNGLTGMRERLEAAGGGLRATRADDGGVRLSAWLPAPA
jgi:signal transduction histidine kinase